MSIDHAKMAVLTSKSHPRLYFASSENGPSEQPFIKIVITGFNTDIERDGVVYHVQTEDKGLNTPLILSLVYAGGEILAAKRTPYEDLIEAGFDDAALAERLKRQHRLICAAINAGRIEELKRMSSRADGSAPPPEVEQPVSEIPATVPVEESPAEPESESAAYHEEFTFETAAERPQTTDWQKVEAVPVVDQETASGPAGPDEESFQPPAPAPPQESAYTVYDSRRPSRREKAAKPEASLVLTLLDDDEFFAGQTVTMRILLCQTQGEKEKPLSGVTLSVKVLGTTFRPQIYPVKTQRDGVALVEVQIPPFTSGRAAVLVRAETNNKTIELRRVIRPAA